jgi:hypothetical protein
MALLNNLIPKQNFEIIRDVIGAVLKTEFDGQKVLDDTVVVPTIYSERFVQFDNTDLPVINVKFNKADYYSKDRTISEGTYQYTIEIVVNGKSTSTKRADHTAAVLLHKIMGMIRAILTDPLYDTLGLERGTIAHTMVKNMYVLDTINGADGNTQLQGAMYFDVQAIERTEIQEGVLLELGITTVKLGLTEKGFVWDIAPPAPDNNNDFNNDFPTT